MRYILGFAAILLVAGLLAIFFRSPPQAGETLTAGGEGLETAIFAGGCFWCMEPPFDGLDGVAATISGYTGGHVHEPSYRQVTSGSTGHAEAVKVLYDPQKITYPQLLEVFWRNIDPTTPDRQFCDVGSQYRSAIFYLGEDQKAQAEASRDAIMRTKPFSGPIVTQIVPVSAFYPAEEYHQDFYKKNPIRYKFYRTGCGRDDRLKELWGERPMGISED